MSIQFRSRLGTAIIANILENQGLCCRGNDLIGTTGEYGYHSCFATGGQYFPYKQNILRPDNSYDITETCYGRNPKNI